MSSRFLTGAVVVVAALFSGVSASASDVHSKPSIKHSAKKTVGKKGAAKVVVGKASWYDAGSRSRRQSTRTAAHRSLPFGTKIKITNLRNGRTSLVLVDDRGPQLASRVIDVSVEAARDLGMLSEGVANVRLEVIASN